MQNRNKKIFMVSFFVFLAVTIGLVAHMASKTNGPWNKKKQLDRVIER